MPRPTASSRGAILAPWHRWLRSQRGSTLVFFAAGLAAFMACAAMAVDVGRLYMFRQQLRVVADGAALAAGRSLPDPAAAQAAAQDILNRNGIPAMGVTSAITVASDGSSADVALSGSFQTIFARLLGVETVSVTTTASAVSGPAGRVQGIVPLGVPNQNFTYGQQVTLKSANNNQYSIPGFFGALDLGGTGASNYENNLDYGYASAVAAGDLVGMETGQMTGPTRQAINYRLSLAPDETWTSYSPTSPRLLMVAVVDYNNVNGNGQVPVLGFAAFFLEGSNGGDIVGRFVRRVTEAEVTGSTTDFGLRVVKLR